MTELVRTVDLFCGCGGLSLGFELYNGSLHYQTVMALDNDPSPVRCFNINFPQSNGMLPVARLCDLTWFGHKSEALLYYLVHFALHMPDPILFEALNAPDMGLNIFFAQLRQVDQQYESLFANLINTFDYQQELKKIDSKTFTMQISKNFLSKMGFTSLKGSSIASVSIPWQEEYSLFSQINTEELELPFNIEIILDDIAVSLNNFWDIEVAKLEEASLKEGKGRNKVVGERLQSLVVFLRSPIGERLKQVWLTWRSQRDSKRAIYCTNVEKNLLSLYSEDRRVHLVLGGPPCKGFSRIGRAVVESLRDQGVHAWSSREYGDERNALLHKYVLFLDALRPDAFIFENVANFQSTLKTPSGELDAIATLDQAISELSTTGIHYNVGSQIVKAREYAIPQDRERFILVGFNNTTTGFGANREFFKLDKYKDDVPLQLALNGLEPPRDFAFSSDDAISSRSDQLSQAYTLVDPNMPKSHVKYIQWIRQPGFGQDLSPKFTNAHIVRKPRADDLALIERFAPGKRWMDYKLRRARTLFELRNLLLDFLKYLKHHTDEDLPKLDVVNNMLERVNEGLLLRLILEESGTEGAEEHHLLSHDYLDKGYSKHGDWLERLSADRPCKTVVAHIGKDTYGYIHPYQNRAISIREAARIQSFPDFFSFAQLGIVDGYATIGNAVPPFLAYTFAEQFAKIDETLGVFHQREREIHPIEEREAIQLTWNML